MALNAEDFNTFPKVEQGVTTAVETCTFHVVTSFDEWSSLAETWNILLNDSASATVFLTWEWLYAWATCFLNKDRSLYIVCIYRANELIGIAPFYLQKVRHRLAVLRELHFLGSPDIGSDYLDVILRAGREKLAAESLYDYLFGIAHAQWDELRLTDVPAESRFLLHFMNCVDEHGKFKEVQRCAVMPQANLPANVDEFFARLSANRRSRYRRDLRRLSEAGTIEHLSFTQSDLNSGFVRFFRLYDAKSCHNGIKMRTFFSTLCKVKQAKQLIQVDILCANGTDIAGLLHLRHNGKLSMLLMAVDKNFNHKLSPGNLLVGMCMQRAIENGLHTYDFLKGDEDYKYHWATDTRASLSVILDQHHLQSILATVGRLMKYAIKVIVR